MEIINNFPTTAFPPTVITIGNFDGCHRGHRLLLDTTVRLAAQHSHHSVVISFTANSKTTTPCLFTPAQKLRSFAHLGLQTCLLHPFNRSLTDLSHQEFLHDRLCQRFNMQQLIVGTDFRFGHQRQGNVAWLQTQPGFALTTIAPLLQDETRISSSAIRALLTTGDVASAAQMLGRAYLLEGNVQRGQQRGSKLGIPTANLSPSEQLLPANGVYAGWAVLDTEPSPLVVPTTAMASVINIGTRPTVSNDSTRVVEVHVIGQNLGELYDKHLAVFLVQRLRAERKFPDVATLRAQIDIDITQAQQLLGECP